MPILDTIGAGGLPCLDLSNTFGTARIYLHGAHVTSWSPIGQRDVLWMSAYSHFAAGKPIRGGIPLCFPWFGGHPTDASKPAHGFARSMAWTVHSRSETTEHTTVVLALSDSAATKTAWPHAFRAELTLTLGRNLQVALTITNTDNAPFSFTEALHTYFGVGDITQTTVDGLKGAAYDDRAGGGSVARTDQETAVTFAAETDRAYVGINGPHIISDRATGRCIRVEKSGAKTTVVWNPWIAKSAAMPDFGNHEWPHMVCVEAANAFADSVTLQPKASHCCATTLTLV